MNIAYLNSNDFSFFSDSQQQLEQLIKHLQSEEKSTDEHGHIEKFINQKGQEILRQLLQGWLDLKAANEGCHDIEIFGKARLEWLKKYGGF